MVQAAPQLAELIKLDIGCGQRVREGFVGMDRAADANPGILHDALVYPWPLEDGSVEEAHCSHFLEHIPGKQRPRFFEELYRVLAPGAVCTFIVPAYNSMGAYQDFTHEWPPVAPSSFMYFDRQWREANCLTHGEYAIACDFEVTVSGNVTGEWQRRVYETQVFAGSHYWNVTSEIHAVLRKR